MMVEWPYFSGDGGGGSGGRDSGRRDDFGECSPAAAEWICLCEHIYIYISIYIYRKEQYYTAEQ